jgi:hypothetical protein
VPIKPAGEQPIRAARVIYQVHSSRISGLAQEELDGVLARHPVETGHIAISVHQGEEAQSFARDSLPPARDFTPALDFDAYARLRQSKWVYRAEATEIEPEDLGYVRAALLVAGELAAMTDGLIVDALAYSTLAAEDVAREVDRPFDPLRHVNLHVDRNGPRPFFVHTHGMEKFAHRDFELHGVPRESLDVARRLLRNIAAAVVSGGHFNEGESTQFCGFSFSFAASQLADTNHFSNGSLCLREFKLLGGVATREMEGMLVA